MFPDPTVFPDPKEFISEFILPSFRKILVTHDGKDKSNKAINYAIYLSKLSGAEITILQIIYNSTYQFFLHKNYIHFYHCCLQLPTGYCNNFLSGNDTIKFLPHQG